MADRFAPALDEIRDALLDGETAAVAVADAAEAAGLPVAALRNRAERAFGDLATYAARRASAAAANAGASAARRDEIAADAARESVTIADFLRLYDFRTNTFRS